MYEADKFWRGRAVAVSDKTRYRLYRIFLILTIVNIVFIVLHENSYFSSVQTVKTESRTALDESDTKVAEKTEEVSYINEDMPEETAGAEEIVEAKPEDAQDVRNNVLIIGDSNIYLMSRNRAEYSKMHEAFEIYWITESGVSVDFITEELEVELGRVSPDLMINTLNGKMSVDLVKEMENNKIRDVFVMLGINQLNDKTAEVVSDRLLKLAEASGSKISYVAVLPFVDKGRYSINNGDIVKHNEDVRQRLAGTAVGYIDAYSPVKNFDGYEAETSDGIHYSENIYDGIFHKMMEYTGKNS